MPGVEHESASPRSITLPTAGVTLPAAASLPSAGPPPSRHEPASDLVCSARACGGHADWALRWNNPRLHTPDRRKVWLACEGHLAHLSEFLSVRGFLREALPVTDLHQVQPA